ncbi:D111/G-patch domain-containing protein [Perilla frutescens var. hirtella]|uniref:D111/G-patch domain-containing protein n=1 Tax=Perilla frutescens var. hirtella TaxID=608512 RepID=A0AAD4JLC5_PERFH|nr:D111/G-patch domain-containing protein [Perilla frutescens var. hirtella]
MEASHILLGRPWQFDRKAIHDGFANTYTVTRDERTTRLWPLTPKDVNEDQGRMQEKFKEEKKKEKQVETKSPAPSSQQVADPKSSKGSPRRAITAEFLSKEGLEGMDNRWYSGKQGMHIRRQQKSDEAYEATAALEDLAEDFRLPINHRVTENVDLDNVEQASLDTHLTSSNVGFRLLQKMGWKGKGLGKDEQGIVEPIKSGIRDARLGLGKQEEDDYFTAEENIQRRKLDIEVEETEELVKKREVIAEREQKIQSEVKEIRKVFYCDLCNKQYKLAMEFEAHLSSYDHNHRKRFKQMKDMHGSSSREDRLKREQQRQEREMAKFKQMADTHKQQQQMQNQEEVVTVTPPPAPSSATAVADQDQRKVLKFGFSAKGSAAKSIISNSTKNKKPKVVVASVFGNDSDEE